MRQHVDRDQATDPRRLCSDDDGFRHIAPSFESVVFVGELLLVERSEDRQIGYRIGREWSHAKLRAAFCGDVFDEVIAQCHCALAVPFNAVRGCENKCSRHYHALPAAPFDPHSRLYHTRLKLGLYSGDRHEFILLRFWFPSSARSDLALSALLKAGRER